MSAAVQLTLIVKALLPLSGFMTVNVRMPVVADGDTVTVTVIVELRTVMALVVTPVPDTAVAYDDIPEALKERPEGVEYRASLKRTPIEHRGPGAIGNSV
jgi:hypothetical protein